MIGHTLPVSEQLFPGMLPHRHVRIAAVACEGGFAFFTTSATLLLVIKCTHARAPDPPAWASPARPDWQFGSELYPMRIGTSPPSPGATARLVQHTLASMMEPTAVLQLPYAMAQRRNYVAEGDYDIPEK